MAGLAGSPHMISATLLAFTKLVFHYRGRNNLTNFGFRLYAGIYFVVLQFCEKFYIVSMLWGLFSSEIFQVLFLSSMIVRESLKKSLLSKSIAAQN